MPTFIKTGGAFTSLTSGGAKRSTALKFGGGKLPGRGGGKRTVILFSGYQNYLLIVKLDSSKLVSTTISKLNILKVEEEKIILEAAKISSGNLISTQLG